MPRRDTIVPALRVSLVLFVYCDYGVEVMAVAVDTSPVASDFLFGYTMYRRRSQLGLTSRRFCCCSRTLCCLLGSA